MTTGTLQTAWPRRVAIVGMGLIGGSLARALRRARPEVELVGIDRRRGPLDRARAAGVLDRAAVRLDEGVAGADLVVLALPVSAILELLPRLPSLLPPSAVVTDTGSTKRCICSAGARALGGRFVGGHPLAGSERSGFSASRADLFEGRPWALVPSPHGSNAEALGKVRSLLEEIGARVYAVDAARHDRVVAATSHVPQLLSWALADLLRSRTEVEGYPYTRLLGGGGEGWLRLAHSPQGLWWDILATNADEVAQALAELQQRLHKWEINLRALKLRRP